MMALNKSSVFGSFINLSAIDKMEDNKAMPIKTPTNTKRQKESELKSQI
jgi:hypothetical protein